MDEDYALALQLQSEFFAENEHDNNRGNNGNPQQCDPQNLVDPYWEMTDPNPDIRALFLQFNERFFWGRLAGIEVKWSPRMTLCAGLCYYERRGGLCSVRLSVPLLQLRPRKDLVETLLHEMIHAYLFVTDNNKDHDGHGPEFHKHMYRINNEAGTSISVYHNFHDEVDACRQHWWRCDGPCRSWKPYFGYVKRSMNRAPSKNDTWWGQHQKSCGGTYTKVKEPEGYGKKKGKKENHDGKNKEKEKEKEKGKNSVKSMDIRIFGGAGKTLGGNKNDSMSSTKSITDDKNTFPKPSTSQTTDNKPIKGDNLMNYGSGDENIPHNESPSKEKALPGGKTPKRVSDYKNKPVSQGGTAKFNGRKKLPLPKFSDSDSEDENSTQNIIPLDDSSGDSSDDWSDMENYIDTQIDDLDDVDTGTLQSGDNCSADSSGALPTEDNYNIITNSQSTQDEVKTGNFLTNNEETDDVRAMLRKVWGQKQFENKFDGSRLSLKTSVQNETTSKIITALTGSTNVKTAASDRNNVISSNKRLSDSSLGNSQPVKRPRSGDLSSSKTEKNIKPKSNMVTSPIDKYFSPTKKANSPVMSLQQATNNGATLTQNTTEEKSNCPICNTLVPMSTINDHLDLCLTLQAIG